MKIFRTLKNKFYILDIIKNDYTIQHKTLTRSINYVEEYLCIESK